MALALHVQLGRDAAVERDFEQRDVGSGLFQELLLLETQLQRLQHQPRRQLDRVDFDLGLDSQRSEFEDDVPEAFDMEDQREMRGFVGDDLDRELHGLKLRDDRSFLSVDLLEQLESPGRQSHYVHAIAERSVPAGTFVIASTAAAAAITHLRDEGLVWRIAPSQAWTLAAMAL